MSVTILLGPVFRHPKRLLSVLVLLALIGLGSMPAVLFLSATWHQRKGRQQLMRFDFDAAHEHFEKSLRLWSRSADTYLEAAQAARRAEKFAAAEQHLLDLRKLQGFLDRSMLESQLLDAQYGSLDGVESLLKAALEKKGPEASLIQEALADAYIRGNRLPDAEQVLSPLLQNEPNHVQGLYHRGRLLKAIRRPGEAIATLERALQLQPNHSGAHNELSLLLMDESPGQAIVHIRFLRARSPADAALKLREVDSLRRQGQGATAVTMLDELVADHPGNVDLLVERGTLALELSQPVLAETWFRKALATTPNHSEANYRLCQALLQQEGRLVAGREQLAITSRIKADLDRLQELTKLVRESQPPPVALLHEAGAIQMRLGKVEEALRWLRDALNLDGTHQETHRILAEYYEKIGEKTRAAEHRQFLQKPGKPEK